jgi:NAD+ kinase
MTDTHCAFRNIGIIYNPRVISALAMAEEIAVWLESQGIVTWRCATDSHDSLCTPADLLVVLGGDGSILRTSQKAAPAGIPLLGFNLGRVGFLTEASPDCWRDVLGRVLAGEGIIEERMMLDVALCRQGQEVVCDIALNDAVIGRSGLARTIHLKACIDGTFLTRYVTDGLIVATPTGSTAYAYALGGPILPPWVHALLVVPAAPHLSLERPLVLNAEAVVEVEITTDSSGTLSVDGRMAGELLQGDTVRVRRSQLLARFLRLRDKADFYRTLVARLTPHNGE